MIDCVLFWYIERGVYGSTCRFGNATGIEV